MSKEQKRDLFYTQSEEQVLSSMGSSLDGLSSDEASKRLADYGRNELDEGEKRTLLAKFLDQFKDLMIIILIADNLDGDYRRFTRFDRCHYHLGCGYLERAFGVYQEGQAEATIEALKTCQAQLRVRFVTIM